MQKFKMIYPYYDCAEMLKLQVANWNSYPFWLREHCTIIIVDDCSPTQPARPVLEALRFPYQLYRVQKDIRWNQHGARNLGAQQAFEGDWLFMSDMDIMLPAGQVRLVFDQPHDPSKHYTFERTFVPEFKERKYHCNTFLVTREKYWEAGGYDEDYCGHYGGDGSFLRALENVAPREHREDIVLHGFGRRTKDGDAAFPGADTQQDRVHSHASYRKLFDNKRRRGDLVPKNPIRFDWVRVV